MKSRKLTARAFMATLSTAGRVTKVDCATADKHPPVIVERLVGASKRGTGGTWVEKRMEWDGEKYVEVVK
jgi:hypothetical protein